MHTPSLLALVRLLALAAVMPTAGASAQQPLFPGRLIDVGGNHNSGGALADLDGDGELDHATAVWTGTVAVSLGAGDGTFAASEHFVAGPTPTDVAALDVDGDLDVDLVVACSAQLSTGASVLVVLRNDGSGQFGAPESTAIDGTGGRLFVADADLDGDADAFVAVEDGARLLLGDGTGAFAAGIGIHLPAGALVVADADGDLDPDLLVAADGLVLRRNDGTGAFAPPETTALPYEPAFLATADVDGDGDIDLIASTEVAGPPSDTLLGVLWNDGAGAFQPAAPQSVGLGAGIVAARALDLDGDGALDLVLAIEGAALAVLHGDGGGAFAGAVHPFSGAGLASLSSFSLGDLNHDGAPDAVLVGKDSLALFPGDGAGGFQAALEVPVIVAVRRVAAEDFDGDGYRDLLSASSGAFLALARGAGDGSFDAEQNYLVSQPSPRLAVLDWDGDLDLDVLSVGLGGAIDLLVGDGSGALSFAGLVDLQVDVLDVVRGDFDADGSVDLIVLHANGGELVSAGPGGFAAPEFVDLCEGEPCASEMRGLAAGDVDSDGVLDLVVAKESEGLEPARVDAFLGTGGGAFAFARSTELATGDVELGDLDGDGRLDLASQWSPKQVRRGDGLGGFDAWHELVPSWLGSGADVGFFDLDADGALDVIQGGGDVYRGDGAGGLAAAECYAWPKNWLGQDSLPEVADVDADGRPDALTLDLVDDRAYVNLALGSCAGEIASYGASSPGAGGFAPRLAVTGCAAPGGTVRATIEGGLGGAPAILLLGTAQAELPLPNGYPLYVAPIVGLKALQLAGAVPGAGEVELTAVLGAAPPGAVATLQALILDAAAPASFTSTNGVRLVLP